MNPSGERGTSDIRGFVQQSRFKGVLQVSKHGVSGAYDSAIKDIGRISKELKDAEPLLITQ